MYSRFPVLIYTPRLTDFGGGNNETEANFLVNVKGSNARARQVESRATYKY